MFRTILGRVLLLSLVALFFPSPAHSYDLKPIVIQLAPSGAGAAQSVVITNTHTQPIAIEVRTFKRAQNPDGTDSLTAEDDDLLVTPPQMVIGPKSSQSFKVRWVGDARPEQELAYRLVTTQLPIKFKQEETSDVSMNVNMTYRYEAALYIVPPQSTPSARLVSVAPFTDNEGKNWLEAKIVSEGTRRAILDKASLVITPKNGGAPVTMTGERTALLVNLNILVGNERIVRLPWPDEIPLGPVTGELRTDYVVFD
ncbi:fimbria/pilus periplasmic chaperone [uncultured Parasphingorhabdus sp.]|uniref:fimbrial biogenesis chaperone n=1 Tax=uncultured Parasphingorhabdus sp. TaxID=2709694 RepID=UPI0030D6E410